MGGWRRISSLLLLVCAIVPATAQIQNSLPTRNPMEAFCVTLAADPDPGSKRSPASIWAGGIGDGFRDNTFEAEFSAAAAFGMRVMGTTEAHDMALAVFDFGWIFTDVLGKDRWYRGNWEFLWELFGGAQYRPDMGYLAGGGPALRYNFATGTRFVPFIHMGGGALATDIRNGDLSTTAEFNLQAGGGARFFLRDNLAVTGQYRFMHISNAGLDTPNLGVNASVVSLGLNWFF